MPAASLHLALSIVAPGGDRIREGRKTLEIRRWQPESLPLRDLVIIQNRVRLSRHGVSEDPAGEAVAMVDVESVAPWTKEQFDAACATVWEAGWLAWKLSNLRPLKIARAFPAKLQIYQIDLGS